LKGKPAIRYIDLCKLAPSQAFPLNKPTEPTPPHHKFAQAMLIKHR
jgi:hypothetical protein